MSMDCDALALVGPVPEPVAVQPEVLLARLQPALGPVAVVVNLPASSPWCRARPRAVSSVDVRDVHEALVGPAGEVMGWSSKNSSRPQHGARGPAAAGLAGVGDALGLEVRLTTTLPRADGSSALERRRVGDGLPARDDLAADDAHLARPACAR